MSSTFAGRLLARLMNINAARFAIILVADALFAILSLYLALSLRFERTIPLEYKQAFFLALPILIGIRLSCTLGFGLHRWSFRMSGLNEGLRLGIANLIGTASFVVFLFFIQKQLLPRSVLALEFFLSTSSMAAFRFLPRLLSGWYAEQLRSRRDSFQRTLIVGAGSAGDLLLRDLVRSPSHDYHVIGFVDDDSRKIGTSLGGKPVFGEIQQLPELIDKHEIARVLIAIPNLPAERLRTILRLCSHQKVTFKIIPASFAFLDERITAAMLDDLKPDDLLGRDAVAFDMAEFRSLLSGKRVLVTGAAGSIGSEIARQVARHAPERLVLVDINENELYFLTRRLQEQYPGLKVQALIADIRDGARILRMGETTRPQFVLHAAAHKHVPLMEDAPEEAVKNNIFGTLNVARMADLCGAERFVLISTDKAVRPSSIMGASKRVAELAVRDLARRSKTAFTAVRFGNVLGSAGSVVPLFKEQIERGGPVTVTHPECTRYFMTISEAVGLVLLAGLNGYGELCVLDMGQPIRIADLAAHMITMAGRVPEVEIPIVYTGLRPGEKLQETLMTEEEEQSHVVRNKIYVAKSPAPPSDLGQRLEDLRRVAEVGDPERTRVLLKEIVPTFKYMPEQEERMATVTPLRIARG